MLPLDASSLGSVAVLGRLADARNLGDGGSSDVWAPSVVTPLEGLRAALGDGIEVIHSDDDVSLAEGADVAVVVVGYTRADEGEFIGGSGTKHLSDLMPVEDEPEVVGAFEAVLAADPNDFQAPDVADHEGLGFSKGGDRTSLRLRPTDEDLIAATVAANPATVVAVVAGSAVMIDSWDRSVPAVVQTWYSGMEGGHALAGLLFLSLIHI